MGLIGSERSAGAAVAQTCSLLYRRFAIGRASRSSCDPGVFGGSQNAILRDSRLTICATSLWASVAQTCSLLYRRFAIGWAARLSSAPRVFGGQQNAILRYSRLKICA